MGSKVIIIKIIKNILLLIQIFFASFIIFVGILWLSDELQWCEYQSDYYMTGKVVDKTVIPYRYSSDIHISIEFENGEIRMYNFDNRSDYPNEYLFESLIPEKTYEFRIGVFIKNHYGRKKNERVENIISATLQ